MQPFAKTPLALLLVQHYSIAECELRIIWPCPTEQKQSYLETGSYTIVSFINIKSYTSLLSITTNYIAVAVQNILAMQLSSGACINH